MVIQKAAVKKVLNSPKVTAFKKSVKKEATELSKEGKIIGTKVSTRWGTASNEEKIYTILGIILLILGLYGMKAIIGSMILIIIGILFVTGFFMKKGKK